MNPKAILAVTQLVPLLIPIAAAIATEGDAAARRDAVIAAIKPQLKSLLGGIEGVAGQDWYDEMVLAQAVTMALDASLLFFKAFERSKVSA